MVDSRRLAVSWYICIIVLELTGCLSAAQDTSSNREKVEESKSLSWKDCHVFMAPSQVNQFGWGVFAGRSYEKDEIVEIAPLVVPMDLHKPVIQNTIVGDYVYTYYRVDYEQEQLDLYYAIIYGMTMYANHQATPNVVFTTFGREPVVEKAPNARNAVGLVATRKIDVGEELFTSYANGRAESWFADRGVPLQNLDGIVDSQIPSQALPDIQSKYCSNIYAGPGVPTWKDGILSILPASGVPFWMDYHSRMAPFDAGWGNAVAKTAVVKGDRLEVAPALIVPLKYVRGTAVGPLVLTWSDLDDDHHDTLMQLRKHLELSVQYQDQSTNWKPVDKFRSFEEIALLPAAGSIGMVRRVGTSGSSNCRLVIHGVAMEPSDETTNREDFAGLGVTLELIATRDIGVGELLQSNLPPPLSRSVAASTARLELTLLTQELDLVGHSYYQVVTGASHHRYDEL